MSARTDLARLFSGVLNIVPEGSMLLHYEHGNPRASISPDVFAVLDDDLWDRSTYKPWGEGKPPGLALEVTLPSREVLSQEERKAFYARLGIRQHFLLRHDPRRPGRRMVEHRLRSGDYVEVQPDAASEPCGALRSETLAVSLLSDDGSGKSDNLLSQRI